LKTSPNQEIFLKRKEKIMKKLLSILLALVMALSLGVMAFADENEPGTDETTECATCENVEDALKELIDFLNSDEFKDALNDAKDKAAELIGNSEGVADFVDDLFDQIEDLSDGAIKREDIMNFLENTEIFDWFINLYIPAIPETTVPTTEPETEENIPQTGSTGAGLAVFAVLSVAAAAAYVSKKR